jgi:hypothetical protein
MGDKYILNDNFCGLMVIWTFIPHFKCHIWPVQSKPYVEKYFSHSSHVLFVRKNVLFAICQWLCWLWTPCYTEPRPKLSLNSHTTVREY